MSVDRGSKHARRRKAYALILTMVLWQASVLGQGSGPPSPGGGIVRPSSPIVRPRTTPRAGPAVPALPAVAPAAAPAATNDGEQPEGEKLNFTEAPVSIVLEDYANKTGRTLLLAPQLPKANVTLVSVEPLAREDYLKAIESVLNMHGIGLIRVDDKFLKVVPNKDIVKDELPIREQQFVNTGDGVEVALPLHETGEIVSQMIQLKHIDVAEATKAIEPLRHPYSSLTPYERINSILVTDTAANINRISLVLRLIDQPAEMREEPHVVKILYAPASDIKAKLEELVAESQKEAQAKPATAPRMRESGSPGATRTLPGVIRARTASALSTPKAQSASQQTSEVVAAAERGIIQGTVKIIADDRTNLLIIITRPENMKFFEKIVKVLDVETAPEVEVKVFRLEFAEAETIAGMLNDLIGAKSTSKDEGRPATGKTGKEGEESRTTKLREYVERNTSPTKTKPETPTAATKVGQLSAENIKILSDERTNSLIIMASRSDLKTIEGIMVDMDMMLSQVLIEAVILEVQLGDSIQSGVDWVQRSMITYAKNSDGSNHGVFSFAGGGGGGNGEPQDATTVGRSASSAIGSGLTYYFSLFDLNMDAIVAMTAGDSHSQILSSPVIVTHDNTEAKIESTEQRYFYKGQRYVGGSTEFGGGRYQDDVDREDVGIKLTVTPHINDKKLVVMELNQEVEQITDGQTIGDTTWPTTLSRTFSANIAVQDRETIVLGGLVKTQKNKSNNGIPLLKDIPFLGGLFSFKKREDTRSEIVVFITPYVIDTPEQMLAEARRRKHSMTSEDLWQKGWSTSKLADPESIDDSLIGDDSTGLKTVRTAD